MDAAGNTLTARGYTYNWNQAGQLKEVKLGTGTSAVLLATYYYDYKNLRSRKETTSASPQGASVTLYTYDEANHLQTEIRAAGGIATPLYSYVWRDDIPVAVIIHPAAQLQANPTQSNLASPNTPDQLVYLEVDHLNTPRIGRDQAGKKVWSWESDAFGSTPANTDPDSNNNKVIINLRFPGQIFDQESGLHYNHHRYYDPQLGRYINSDPSGLQGGLNSFAYANANSLRYIDPNGKNALLLGVGALGLGVGIGIGVFPNPLKPPMANNGNSSDFPFGDSGVSSSNSFSSSTKTCDPDDRCEKLNSTDTATCNGITRFRGPKAGARCHSSASQRYAACLRGQPIPPLDTWNN